MAHPHLATYLNDHLSGSAAAVELLANLATAYSGTEVEPFALELRAEILAERKELESLMARLEISQSLSRKMCAWIGEKAAQLKLRLDDPTTGAFRLMESVEALSIGIEGKRLLWRSLETAAEGNHELRMDFPRLEQQALDQRRRVEAVRLGAAKTALTESK